MIWDLQGTENQNAIIRTALDACDFPFELLVPKLSSTKGKVRIPVDWADLSTYGAQAVRGAEQGTSTHTGHHDNHVHDHSVGEYDLLEYRSRVLGLAWYSGRVTMDISLERDHQLAREVFLSEGAHMVDFFYMTDEQRQAIALAFHGGDATPHGHDWFDVGSYREWVGEAFMGGFIKAFASTIPVTIPFVHPATAPVGLEIRRILLPAPPPTPTPTPVPVPDDHDHEPVFASNGGKDIYHDSHHRVKHDRTFANKHEAEAAGYRACKVCKPR